MPNEPRRHTRAFQKEVRKEKRGLKRGQPEGLAYARATNYFKAHRKKIYLKHPTRR